MRNDLIDMVEAVKLVGDAAVEAVERENCEPTSRLRNDCDNTVEYVASIDCEDNDGTAVTLSAYYYPTDEELDSAGEDLGNVDWVIAGYTVY